MGSMGAVVGSILKSREMVAKKSRAMVVKSRTMVFVIFWRGSVDFLRRNSYSMVEFELCKTSNGQRCGEE